MMRSLIGSTRAGKSSACGASDSSTNVWPAWRSARGPDGPGFFPPELVVQVKAAACELPATLGRPLSLNAANTPVNLLLPGQLYGDWVNQVDLRVAKVLRFGRTRTLVGIDVYNILNANPGLTFNQGWGADGNTWDRPLTVLYPRFVRFNATIDF